MTTDTLFSRHGPLGEFALRPVRMPDDVELLHTWLTHPKSAYWMMTEASLETVRQEFERIEASTVYDAFAGLHDSTPAFLMERYDPEYELGRHYEVQPGDVGMHFLVAPTSNPVHGFTRAVIRTVMAFLFSEPATERVVVEPDARNTAVHALNESVGFRVDRTITMESKQAFLSFCTRRDFEATLADDDPGGALDGDDTRSRA